jgi:glycosyltransferase involved in cell wall biosynthesis
VCAGRLEHQKGQDVLLESLAALRARGLTFFTAFAGEGSQRAQLEARAAELGLSAHVQFLGQVEDVGPLLLAADAVVLPSRWEGLPLTLLEALARGRPVVATAVGGVAEVIEDGENGRLVPPEDPAAIAGALQSFYERPDAALLLGREGAQLIEERYTWDHVAAEFESLYDEVVGLASFAPGDAPRGGR